MCIRDRTVRAASDSVLLNFERPADQSDAAKVRRAGFGKKFYDKYATLSLIHICLMRLKQHMVDYYRREKHGTDGWILKGDVHHFFASIDHDKLKRKLKALLDKRGVDPQIYDLLCVYINTTDGLPLGYQTSQLLALMFLDEFDHLMKEKYRLKYYGRYMDDFYVILSDKQRLKEILKDIRALMDSWGLELNQKTGIFPLRNGIDFLGFHSYITESGGIVQKLRRDSIQRIRAKTKFWEDAYKRGEVTKEAMCAPSAATKTWRSSP